MSVSKKIVTVSSNHINSGIKKYGGVEDAHLSSLLKAAGLTYTPYLFNDGRILLVLSENMNAFLYPDKEFLFAKLNLD